ncbi:TPA: hypothetical protein ACWLXL_004360 [Pseudomonas aeruginosa]
MSIKALLLVTLTLAANEPRVVTTTNVLDSANECVPAMRQIADHHNLQNHIFSQGKEYLKARQSTAQGNITLSISCKELK